MEKLKWIFSLGKSGVAIDERADDLVGTTITDKKITLAYSAICCGNTVRKNPMKQTSKFLPWLSILQEKGMLAGDGMKGTLRAAARP